MILYLDGVVKANDRGVLGFFEKECDGDWRVFTELKDNLVKATGGFGIEFESFNKSTINLDYAIEFNQIGASNLISISAKL